MGATRYYRPRGRRIGSFCLGASAVGLLCVGTIALRVPTTQGQTSGAQLSVVSSDDEGVTLVLDTPRSAVRVVSVDDGSALMVAGESFSAPEVGRLPERGVLVGVPPGVAVRLAETCAEAEVLSLGGLTGGTGEHGADPAALTDDPVALTDEAWIRDLRVVRLAVRPIGVRPSGELVLRRRIEARLIFEGEAAMGRQREDPHWERAMARLVANWPSAARWRTADGHMALDSEPNPIAAEGGWKILVDEPGWQLIPAQDLIMSGLPGGHDPARVRLFDNNIEIPLAIDGGQDGRLDGGDRIYFYGRPVDTRYADTNVYWLTVDSAGTGARLGSVPARPGSGTRPDAFTDTLHFEKDLFYDPLTPGSPDEDRFYWRRLAAGGAPISASHEITFSLPGLQEGPAAIRMRLKGATAGGHRVQLTLNSQLVADRLWTGQTPVVVEASLLDTYGLAESTNSLVVEAIGAGPSEFMEDWLEIDYPRDFDARGGPLEFEAETTIAHQIIGLPDNDIIVLDVTEPYTPVLLSEVLIAGVGPYVARFEATAGHRYHVTTTSDALRPAVELDTPADLITARRADVIIVNHTTFRGGALYLHGLRFQQQFRVRTIEVQDCFDAFSDGEPDPAAIRAFAAHAYANWLAPAPSYLVLFGDGHYDYRHFVTEAPWFIPPIMVESESFVGELGCDNQYVAVSGDDIVPDMAVGRIVSNDRVSSNAAVDRITGYEQASPQPWNDRALVVADDGPPDAESGEDFNALGSEVARVLPSRMTVQRVTLGQGSHPSAASVRNAIAAALGNGRVLVAYLGEGQRQQWAEESIWRVDDVMVLDNSDLTVALELTGMTGAFFHPDARSLAETFTDRATGGAIASWAAVGEYTGPGHEIAGRAWVQAVFDDGYRGGAAAMVAKAALFAAAPEREQLVHTLTWLGDPVLAIAGVEARDPPSPTPIVTLQPSATPTPTSTATASSSPTASASPTTTASPTAGSATPGPSATASPSASPSAATTTVPSASETTTPPVGTSTVTPTAHVATGTVTPTISSGPGDTPTSTAGPSPTTGPSLTPSATVPHIPGEGSAIYIPLAYKP